MNEQAVSAGICRGSESVAEQSRWKHSALRHAADEADVYTLTSSARRPHGYDIIKEVRVQKLVKKKERKEKNLASVGIKRGKKKKQSTSRIDTILSAEISYQVHLVNLFWGIFTLPSELLANEK